MVDWRTNELNVNFWIMFLTAQMIARPFEYFATESSTPDVYAQGIRSAKGSVIVLVNKKNAAREVSISGVSGSSVAVIDQSTGNKPARKFQLSKDTISLSPFAVAFV